MRTLFPLPPEQTERRVQDDIRAYLERELGLRVFRADATLGSRARRSGASGLPDLFGILPGGRWFGVECKKPGARPRPNEAKQNDVLDHLRANGAMVIVARSVLEVRAAFDAEGVTTRTG